MSAKTYKKLQVTKLSTNFREACQVVEVPFRPVEEYEILIRNHWSAVNGTDVNTAAGRYVTDGVVPFDIGFEGHGVVQEVGSCVNSFKVGDAVMFLGIADGYSEFIYTDVRKGFPVLLPAPSVRVEYLGAWNCGLTAAIGLSEAARIQKGDKVLITAAAGGTGHIAVQWAKLKGCHVIGITSTDEKAAFLRSIGADHVINYKREDLRSVLEATYPDGIDVVWETIGGQTFEMLFQQLAMKGRLVTLGGISGYLNDGFPDIRIDNLPTKLLLNSISLIGFKIFDYVSIMPDYCKQLMHAIDSGSIRVRLDQGEGTSEGPFVGMDGCVRAVQHMISGQSQGRVVIKIQ